MLNQITYEYYDTVDSTNDRIKDRARQNADGGLVISAGTQTAGKGRIGRKWESPTHDSISTSMLMLFRQLRWWRLWLLEMPSADYMD